MTEAAPAPAGPLLTTPVGRVLLRLTGPMVFGLTAIILFQVVDTFFVGMLGPNELAAMSFTFPVGFAVMSIAMGLGLATTAVIAHAIGQGDSTRVKRLTTHSLLLAVSVVSIVGSVGIFTQELLFGRLLGAPVHLLPLINDYMTVYFASVGFLVIPMVGNSAIRATGDTKTPSVIMAVAGLANALLDPLLIFGWGPIPGYGLLGAATATAFAWVITFFWAIYVLHAREHMLEWVLPRRSTLVASWRALLKIGLPAAGSNLMIPLGQMALTRMVAGFGALSVAAFGVGTRIESLAMIGVFAMSTALNPVVAQNFGAGKLERVKQALVFAARYCLVLGAATASLLYFTAQPLAELFSDSIQVANGAGSYLEIVPWSYGALGIGVVAPTLLNALNRANQGAMLTAVRLFVCILPCAYFGSQWAGFHGLLIGLAVGNTLVGLTAWLYAHRIVQRALREEFEPGLLEVEPSLPPTA